MIRVGEQRRRPRRAARGARARTRRRGRRGVGDRGRRRAPAARRRRSGARPAAARSPRATASRIVLLDRGDEQRAVGAVLGLGAEVERDPLGVGVVRRRSPSAREGPASRRSRPCRRPGASPPGPRRCRGRRSRRPARSSRCRRRARRSPGRRRSRRPRRPRRARPRPGPTRVDLAVGPGRRRDRDPLDARDPGRDRAHQDARRVGGPAARGVDAGRADRDLAHRHRLALRQLDRWRSSAPSWASATRGCWRRRARAPRAAPGRARRAPRSASSGSTRRRVWALLGRVEARGQLAAARRRRPRRTSLARSPRRRPTRRGGAERPARGPSAARRPAPVPLESPRPHRAARLPQPRGQLVDLGGAQLVGDAVGDQAGGAVDDLLAHLEVVLVRVRPVATRSTIPSARPTSGASSTEPLTSITSAWRPVSSK